ncbi:MAG: hypothetical protein NTY36_16030 [Deltaproteobacteria bacterium]|nr:hypothetical protein [Deltaproteobacteria bacterium]
MPNVALYTDEPVVKPTGDNWLVTTKGTPEKNLRRKMRERYMSAINQYQKHPSKGDVKVCIIKIESLQMKFKRLLTEWKQQSVFLSSATAMAMLPSYQGIIGMGEPVLPLILNELKDRPAHLFWALRAISGIDPVPQEDKGNIGKMMEAWLNWGRQKRFIK